MRWGVPIAFFVMFFTISLNFQAFFIEQELINAHKYDSVFVLVAFYRVFGNYKLLEVIRYVHQ